MANASQCGNGRAYSAYLFLVFATILHVCIGAFTILAETLHQILPFYSFVAFNAVLCLVTFVFGLSVPAKPAPINDAALLPLLLIGIGLLATMVDIVLGFSTEKILSLTFKFFSRAMLVVVFLQLVFRMSVPPEKWLTPFRVFFFFGLVTGFILVLVFFLGAVDSMPMLDTSYFKKNAEGNFAEQDLYSFPLGLGLIVTGQDSASLFGFTFPQFAGYYLEPAVWAFYSCIFALLFIRRSIAHVPFMTAFALLFLWAASTASFIASFSMLCAAVFVKAPRRIILLAIFVLVVALCLTIWSPHLFTMALPEQTVSKPSSGVTSVLLLLRSTVETEISGIPFAYTQYRGLIFERTSAISALLWLMHYTLAWGLAVFCLYKPNLFRVGLALTYANVHALKSVAHLVPDEVYIVLAVIALSKLCSHATVGRDDVRTLPQSNANPNLVPPPLMENKKW